MRAVVLLIALSAGLALLVASQLYGTPEAGPPEPSPSPAPVTTAGTALPKIVYADKRAYARINDDNLFGPERLPPIEEARPGPKLQPRPAAGLPGFELKGVVITPKGRYALLKLRGKSDYRKVVKGETVEGWVVDAIESDSVLVKKQGTSSVVKLKTPKSSGPRAPTRPRSRRPPPRR